MLCLFIRESLERNDSKGRAVCWYIVCCEHGPAYWTIERRFSQFLTMDRQLRATLTSQERLRLPAFPSSHWITFVGRAGQGQARRKALETYLRELAALADRAADAASPRCPSPADFSPRSSVGRGSVREVVRDALLRFIDAERHGGGGGGAAGSFLYDPRPPSYRGACACRPRGLQGGWECGRDGERR